MIAARPKEGDISEELVFSLLLNTVIEAVEDCGARNPSVRERRTEDVNAKNINLKFFKYNKPLWNF